MLKLKKEASQMVRERKTREYFARDGNKPNKTLFYMNRFGNFKHSFPKGIDTAWDMKGHLFSYEYSKLFYHDIKHLENYSGGKQ